MADVGRIEFGPKEFNEKMNAFPRSVGITDKETKLVDEIDEVIRKAASLPNDTLKKCHKHENMFNPYAIMPDEVDRICSNPFYEERIEEDYHPHDALSRQVGGSHYKSYKIQPYEFFIKNQIPHHKAAIIRRILRYDHPTGKGLEDLQKIQHEIDLIIQLENWEGRSGTPTETEEDR